MNKLTWRCPLCNTKFSSVTRGFLRSGCLWLTGTVRDFSTVLVCLIEKGVEFKTVGVDLLKASTKPPRTSSSRNFSAKRDFVSTPKTLKRRLMLVGPVMPLLSPFFFIFMLVYLFLRHAEQFYNYPSTASSWRWSNLSKWIFREYNDVLLR